MYIAFVAGQTCHQLRHCLTLKLTLAVCIGQVITKQVEGHQHEPFEEAVVELPEAHVGSAVDLLGQRKGTMQDLSNSTGGLTRLTYRIPTRSVVLSFCSVLRPSPSCSGLRSLAGLLWSRFDVETSVSEGASRLFIIMESI